MKLAQPFVCETASAKFTFDGENWDNEPRDVMELFLLDAWIGAALYTHADLTELAAECAKAVLQEFRVISSGQAPESDVPEDAEG
jgi:hypothetical protein